MNVLALPVKIRRGEVLHYLGYRDGKTPGARVESMLREILEEARGRIDARGLYLTAEEREIATLGLQPIAGAELVLGISTIGPALEEEVARALRRGDSVRGLLLDAAGSAAAEEAADRLERRILKVRREVPREPCPRGFLRFSPGYGDWPVTAQRALFDLLPAGEIGVSLLPSCLMVPRKSVSFALWLGAAGAGYGPGSRPGERCEVCGLPGCAFRRTSAAGGTRSPNGAGNGPGGSGTEAATVRTRRKSPARRGPRARPGPAEGRESS